MILLSQGEIHYREKTHTHKQGEMQSGRAYTHIAVHPSATPPVSSPPSIVLFFWTLNCFWFYEGAFGGVAQKERVSVIEK